MTRLTITLPEETAAKLQREARRRRLSVSELVREKLDASGHDEDRFDWIGAISDPEMVPARDLDKFLAENWADDIARDRG